MQRTFVNVLGFSALILACKTQPSAPGTATQVLDAAAQERGVQARSDAGAPPKEWDAGANIDVKDVPETTQCDASRCARQGDQLARSLTMSETISPTIMGGDCARVDIDGEISGMACTCQTSNGWIYIGPKGAGCFARGRAGDCLWGDSEFEPCSAGDPKCAGECDELERRYAADAARSFKVEVRLSTCRDGSCRHVLRIEDFCYTDRSIGSGGRFDCNLSDSDILDREDHAR
jgi:hypothetical protein